MYVFGLGVYGVDRERSEWMKGLGLGFTNPVGTGGWCVGRVSVFWLRRCGWCRWGVNRGLGPWS